MAALLVLALMGGALHAVFQQLEQRALVWWRGR